jgi:flagellar biosynthesis/type III secretory pathway chaperone
MAILDFRYQLSSGLYSKDVEVTELKQDLMDQLEYIDRLYIFTQSEIDVICEELYYKNKYSGNMMVLYLK